MALQFPSTPLKNDSYTDPNGQEWLCTFSISSGDVFNAWAQVENIGLVDSITAGTGIAVDSTDPEIPIVSNTGVLTVVAGTSITVDSTDASNPIITNTGVITVVGGTNITVDNTDSNNPIVATSALGNIVEDITPQLGGNLDTNDKAFLESSYLQAVDATVVDTATHTFDFLLGDFQQLTTPASGGITIAFSGFITGKVCTYMIDAVNWGGVTVTYPAGMLFNGGIAPTFTAVGLDKLMIVKDKDEVYSLSIMQLDSKVAV